MIELHARRRPSMLFIPCHHGLICASPSTRYLLFNGPFKPKIAIAAASFPSLSSLGELNLGQIITSTAVF